MSKKKVKVVKVRAKSEVLARSKSVKKFGGEAPESEEEKRKIIEENTIEDSEEETEDT